MPLPPLVSSIVRERTSPGSNSLAALLVAQSLAYATAKGLPPDLALAASFDLLVAAKYYGAVRTENWLWCEKANRFFYPFLNACPYCASRTDLAARRFIHHHGNKPQSGSIGPATADAFREILSAYFEVKQAAHVAVFLCSEPVDIAIVDEKAQSIFVAEIKASPLFTPPLQVPYHANLFRTSTKSAAHHQTGTLQRTSEIRFGLYAPGLLENKFYDGIPFLAIESPKGVERQLFELIAAAPEPLFAYYDYWAGLWRAYMTKTQNALGYWLTGACGLPRNPGEDWPKSSSGKPIGSISDSKTSVGMDRTDDIKKSTFQMLNLGVSLRRQPLDGWELHIGIASNLHAARHYDKYLSPYTKLVWGWREDTPQDAAPTSLHNLFDGIVTLSQSHLKSPWLNEITAWHQST